MRNFQLVANVDVLPIAMRLHTRPDLWNQHRFRTTYANTPHIEVDDILLRFSDPGKDSIATVIEDQAPVFYPAWEALPEVRPVIFDLMRRFEAIALGRVVITRLKPGAVIAPHRDDEGAYTDTDSGLRFHVAIQGLPGSLYHCGPETVQMLTGQCWWFNHRVIHSVENNSADDRIHLLVDMQRAPSS